VGDEVTLAVGIHDISAAAYNADPCEQPSLTRSGIHALLTGTPAEFMAQHPRLTRWPEKLKRTGTDATDLGEIVHALVLGVGAAYVVADAGDFLTDKGLPAQTWGSSAGKAFREQCEAEGKVIIGRERYADALRIQERLVGALQSRYPDYARGVSEQTMIWKRILNEHCHAAPNCDHHATCWIWCRARTDRVLPSGQMIDVKTREGSLSDDELGKCLTQHGLTIQHCWYQEGLHATWPNDVKPLPRHEFAPRPPFEFAFAQTVPPYSVTFVNLDDPDIAWPIVPVRMLIDVACERFAHGLRTGEWGDVAIDAKPIAPSWWVSMLEAKAGIAEIEA
jgi:hypothetical protein